jgi:sulfoxide reductase catalytic subunit YedY
LGSAKYVEIEKAQDKMVPGPRSPLCLWSYFEGLALDEVGDDLPFISTGLCGKPLLPQNSGLIRLATPRKIGVKSAKALAKISFAVNFWHAI